MNSSVLDQIRTNQPFKLLNSVKKKERKMKKWKI